MHKLLPTIAVLLAMLATASQASAQQPLLSRHCQDCHNDADREAGFSVTQLGPSPSADSLDRWATSLDYVKAGEMPPPDHSELTPQIRRELVEFLQSKLRDYRSHNQPTNPVTRRLNNRELANSVSDVLLIEHPGTHQPFANLLGDTLKDGFDTDAESLVLSEYHLEQYIAAFRKVLDTTILTGHRPQAETVHVSVDDMFMQTFSQRDSEGRCNRTAHSIDFLDPAHRVKFLNFETVPSSGWYRIRIDVMAVDRGIYDASDTGIYPADPIRLKIHLGQRERVFELPDGERTQIEVKEWLAAGTKIELSYPTDGLRLLGNGNFKFQFRIAHDYLKKNDPSLYEQVLAKELKTAPARTAKNPAHWSHWVDHWQGARPRLFGAHIEGPLYESWPPKRQTALLGENPNVDDAAQILQPIAQRAWRRDVEPAELDSIANLVRTQAKLLGETEAFKEGILAILVSPSFLMFHPADADPADRFAARFSYLLSSTAPDGPLRKAARRGELDSYNQVRAEVQRRFKRGQADEFLREFPTAWFQLDRINFMAPDPDHYPMYDRKRLSEDMVAEVLRFFEHAIDNNIPLPEFLSADYSFINADLAKVYGVADVPQDSVLRKHTFRDGRRGGVLGMGAFLTLTADSLNTSPIHRAVYVMENFLGIHPTPPPPDVEITEPDVRQAKTIKEILAAHTADANCASCHARIDPYGYAFENFDPVGAWRDQYTMHIEKRPSSEKIKAFEQENAQRVKQGLPPLDKPWEAKPIPVDASATFRNGKAYDDIHQYRRHLQSDANRERFVRCFITKLLTYANGFTPTDHAEIERIVARAEEHDYRIVDTIAAVLHSPLVKGLEASR